MQREWRNDKELWQYFRQYSLISSDEQANWAYGLSNDKSVKFYGIKADGHEVGTCGFTSIDKHNQKAEFSLFIAPEYQGGGIGWKALSTLLEHGFRDHNFKRIWGEVYDGNNALTMFKRIGMQYEGTLRSSYYRDGKFIDSHIVSAIREEWL